jgi:hypothetical protein
MPNETRTKQHNTRNNIINNINNVLLNNVVSNMFAQPVVATTTQSSKAAHERTQKHQKALNQEPEPET